jgi:succinate dehydrogenase/fumarate reductase flavoprotein subunit
MTETFDVIVIGFGVAGANASIEAHDCRARVLILEKQSTSGGISICAGGGARIAVVFGGAGVADRFQHPGRIAA